MNMCDSFNHCNRKVRVNNFKNKVAATKPDEPSSCSNDCTSKFCVLVRSDPDAIEEIVIKLNILAGPGIDLNPKVTNLFTTAEKMIDCFSM